MKTSAKGLDFIVKEEGVILHPYRDGAGFCTIGVGSRYYENGKPVKMSDPAITLDRAYDIFHITLKYYEDQVNKSITRPINQNQFDALVSLTYNIGVNGFASSTVVRKVNANPCDPEIRYWVEAWRNSGGKAVLLARRKREADFYFS